MDNHEQANANKKQLPQQQSVPPLTATFRSQSFAEGGNRAPLLLPPNRLQSTGTSISSQQQTVKQAPQAAATSLSSLLSQKRPASEVQTTSACAAASPLPCIPSLPPIHILERNHLVIDDDERRDDRNNHTTAAAALVDRIVDFLRVQSIAYTTNEADAGCLDCTTASRLNFVIQFWRTNTGNSNSSSSSKIIVEIQRRQGCCIEMNSIRRGLVQEVTRCGDDERSRQLHQQLLLPQAAASRRENGSFCSKRPRTLPPHDARLNCEDALKISLRLLESDKKDQQQLGWESLSILTNPMYCSQQDALMVSRAIVLGDSLVGQRLQQGMQRVLTNHNSSDQAAAQVTNHQQHQHQQPTMLHHLALQTLANALELTSPHNLVASDFWQAILIVLFRDFDQASTSPQEGAWSAKCIRLLMPRLHDQKLPQFLDASSFQGMVNKALEYGKARHLSLEQESSSLLKTML